MYLSDADENTPEAEVETEVEESADAERKESTESGSTAQTQKPINLFGKLCGFFGLIPLLGFPFALMAIVLGAMANKKKRLGAKAAMIQGVVGLVVNIALVGAAYYMVFVQKNQYYDQLIEYQTKERMNEIPYILHKYQHEHGEYPEKLEDLGNPELYADPISNVIDPAEDVSPTFYYERTDDGKGFYIFGVGEDGYPFTADDFIPEETGIRASKRQREGLNIHTLSIDKSADKTKTAE